MNYQTQTINQDGSNRQGKEMYFFNCLHDHYSAFQNMNVFTVKRLLDSCTVAFFIVSKPT